LLGACIYQDTTLTLLAENQLIFVHETQPPEYQQLSQAYSGLFALDERVLLVSE
jgi:hypothetical protein